MEVCEVGFECLEKQPWSNPIWVGEISDSPSLMIEPRRPDRLDEEFPMHIWEFPKAGGTYTIAIDPSMGRENGDPAAIQVIGDWGQQAAEVLLRNIEPRGQAEIAMWLGRLYNNAFMVVEVNSFGIVLWQLMEHRYKNLWNDSCVNGGFTTTLRRKQIMIKSMNMALKIGEPFLHSKRLREEMVAFGRSRDEQDDLMMAMLIAHGARGKGVYKL